MGMKPQTIALIAAGTAVSLGVGYLVYFDYKRRNDPQFRRKLSKVLTNLSCCLRTTRVCWQKTLSLSCKNYVEREQKKLAKEAKKAEEKAKLDIAELIKSVLDAASKEAYPKTPEEKEKYFMEQVALGEGLCAKGLYDTIFRGKKHCKCWLQCQVNNITVRHCCHFTRRSRSTLHLSSWSWSTKRLFLKLYLTCSSTSCR